MPLRIERSPRAKRDAFEIWDYIAPESRSGAERTLRRIDAVIQKLAERPELGRARPELGSGMRSFPMESYVIFYRATETTLHIARLLHSARNIEPDTLDDD